MEQTSGDYAVVVDEIEWISEEASPSLTLIWLLKGELEISLEGSRCQLTDNDIKIVNRGQRWQLAGAAGNVTLRVTFSGRWLLLLDDNFFSHDYVIPEENSGRWPHCNELRHLLRQLLAVTLLNHPEHYRLQANRWIGEILLLLTTRFQRPVKRQPRAAHPRWSRRISQVVARIESSYARRITLSEIAKAEFVSEAWLSRLFHREVGVSFIQYITTLRLQKAADALRQTSSPLHQIALEHGFASTRMMSDLFRRHYGITPRAFRQQAPQQSVPGRIRHPAKNALRPVAAERLFALLSAPESQNWEPPALAHHPLHEQDIDLHQLSHRPAQPGHPGIVVTLRELEDLLRSDVRLELDRLSQNIEINGIDIAEPFLSSRLFAYGWDDPQMAGYACWYNLHQVFSWVATKQWSLILHTGQTTRTDLLERFLQLAVNHFPQATTRSWHFVFHWSQQAENTARSAAWFSLRKLLKSYLPGVQLGIWHCFSANAQSPADTALLNAPSLRDADFLASTADANAQLNDARLDPASFIATENYPVQQVRQIKHALRQHQLNLPLWLLAWNTLTGNTRATNGGFFRGALLMSNLLGLSPLTTKLGFWLNSGLQGELRASDTLDTSSLSLQYNHGLPRPIYWVLWFWQRLRGDILMQDKNLLLMRHKNGYQLLLYNTVVFNPWLSSEEAFIQQFRQQYLINLTGIEGQWRIKSHFYDLHNGALFPLLSTSRAESGPDDEVLEWILHKARPTLSVHDEHLPGGWKISGALESNALALYELLPLHRLPPSESGHEESP